jgi:uncharacterized coiled-coil protein SlyX
MVFPVVTDLQERIHKLEIEVSKQRHYINNMNDRISDILKIRVDIDTVHDSGRMLLRTICAEHGYDIKLITSRIRDRETVNKRYIVAKFLQDNHKNLAEIGRLINRDHTTIRNLLKRGIK